MNSEISLMQQRDREREFQNLGATTLNDIHPHRREAIPRDKEKVELRRMK